MDHVVISMVRPHCAVCWRIIVGIINVENIFLNDINFWGPDLRALACDPRFLFVAF